ncbi:MAG: Rrf2 family transcriptional regulator [Mariprofundaceae bacterium]|nr:Rrf2 family transcriptional regulator [Mariprofundaceae bacterium]
MLDLLRSKRLRLVMTALLHIAASKRAVSGKLLAEKLHCSRRYLESDLQSMAQCGLLESRRGAHGGYVLARNPQRITLLDVVQCLAMESGDETAAEGCQLQTRVVLPQLRQARDAMAETLAAMTLADGLAQAEKHGLLHAPSTPDFCI